MCVSASMTLTFGSAMFVSPLRIAREPEVHAAVARIEPATRYYFATGEEVHAFDAMGVAVAEQRVLPPAERVVRDRYRYRHVDTDHPDLDFVLEPPCRAPVVREDRGAVPPRVGVDQRERVVVALGPNDAEHRPEDLVGVDGHLGRYVVEECRPEPEALLVALE